MSEKLPIQSGKEIIKALNKIGFVPVRQRGSHVFMRHSDGIIMMTMLAIESL